MLIDAREDAVARFKLDGVGLTIRNLMSDEFLQVVCGEGVCVGGEY